MNTCRLASAVATSSSSAVDSTTSSNLASETSDYRRASRRGSGRGSPAKRLSREAARRSSEKMAYFSDDQAREIIRETYGQVKSSHGPVVAEGFYSPEELAGLPREAIEFALGVANPVRHANLRPGEDVLDLGCGAGIDTLLAARAVGSAGTAIGVDMTAQMVARARANAAAASLSNV